MTFPLALTYFMSSLFGLVSKTLFKNFFIVKKDTYILYIVIGYVKVFWLWHCLWSLLYYSNSWFQFTLFLYKFIQLFKIFISPRAHAYKFSCKIIPFSQHFPFMCTFAVLYKESHCCVWCNTNAPLGGAFTPFNILLVVVV